MPEKVVLAYSGGLDTSVILHPNQPEVIFKQLLRGVF